VHLAISFCIAGTLIFQDHSVFTHTIFAILDTHHIIVVVKLVVRWKSPVLFFADWQVWFGVSAEQYLGNFILEHVSEDTCGQFAHHSRPFLSQLNHSQHVAPPFIGSTVCVRVTLFGSEDVLLNQILSGFSVAHNILI
jgi:hypothetical protein